MKQIEIILIAAFSLWGCEKQIKIDTTPPPPPQGIQTISLDNAVEIQWLPSQADDVNGYNVWVSSTYDGEYELIGSTSIQRLVDYGALNGVTYYYAVSAFDFDENESKLSMDVAYDTPRPEGYGVVVSDYLRSPEYAGFNFSHHVVLNFDNLYTDFFYENVNGHFYLNVWDDSDIQDMGFTSSIDEISSSPAEGWAPSKSAEAITDHSYVVWTRDNHFAKIRVKEASALRLVFDWAYQTAEGNPELKRVPSTQSNRERSKSIALSSVK